MSILCGIAGHKLSSRTIWNAGEHFSRCVRCHIDLIEQSGKWAAPPRGYRIVWKKRAEPVAPASPVPAVDATIITPAILELTPDLLAAAPVPERRAGGDRRAQSGPLPGHLAGRDRRLLRRDQRKGFGRKADAA